MMMRDPTNPGDPIYSLSEGQREGVGAARPQRAGAHDIQREANRMNRGMSYYGNPGITGRGVSKKAPKR